MQISKLGIRIIVPFVILVCATAIIWAVLPTSKDSGSAAGTGAATQLGSRGLNQGSLGSIPKSVSIDPPSLGDQDGTSNTPPHLIWLLISLSLATTISVGISFYLYRWRKILLANNQMVVPEEWAKYLLHVGDGLKVISDQFATRMESVSRETKENSDRIGGMTETYLELHSALDDRDAEIKRLKAGYDAEIFRKYIRRFVSIEREVDEFMTEGSQVESMQYLKRLFTDAFDECGVSRFSPEVGEDYRLAWGVADHPEKIQTEELERDSQVAEILEEGYQLSTENGRSLIVEAKVKIYHYLNQGEQ